MIIEITALVASIVALVAQVLTMREQDKKWDEYFDIEKKQNEITQDDEIVIENKIKGSILLKPKEQ
jgi:cytidylate kinase